MIHPAAIHVAALARLRDQYSLIGRIVAEQAEPLKAAVRGARAGVDRIRENTYQPRSFHNVD